ncbi:MAG TPA: hypothetical protein VF132_04255, partial [Rudaea sp.]
MPARAVTLNPRGLGQALIYPYYTVNGNHVTLFSLVNTTAHGKALRLYMREARNGREVLGFNLYLAPQDTWAAQIVLTKGGAGISTTDTSCTVPTLPKTAALAQPFLPYDYDGTTQIGTDGGPTDIGRTREGYIEIIEMGEVTGDSRGTLSAITPINDAPPGCAALTAAWLNNGYWLVDPKIDLSPPGGGLYGTVSIINVEQGTMYSANAAAIDGFSATIQHTIPYMEVPDLASANDGAGATTVTASIPLG